MKKGITMKRITLLLAATGILASSCMHQNQVDGNGEMEMFDSKLDNNVNNISIEGGFDVDIVFDTSSTIWIETESNLYKYLDLEKKGSEFIIEERRHYNIRETYPIVIHVNIEALNKIKVSGSSDVRCDDIYTDAFEFIVSGSGDLLCDSIFASTVKVDISGSGNVEAYLNTNRFSTEISGSGNIRCDGVATKAYYKISGSGDLSCANLICEDIEIDISGSGDAKVHATDNLDIDISGSGDIRYRGGAIVTQSISGSGSAIPF